MKAKILVLVLICLFLVYCGESLGPDEPESAARKAKIVLDGTLQRTYTNYDRPQFEGYVKNTGNGTGYNCMVEITCYSDPNKTTIIDNAHGFPADLGDIAPGQRAYFNAVAFECTSHSQIQSYSVKITWLDRDY